MLKLPLIAALCVISACTMLFAGTPSTIQTTAPTTQPAKRLGIVLVDERDYKDKDGRETRSASGCNLIVNGVIAGSRAEKMGLLLGDGIKRINGQDMNTTTDVVSAIQRSELLKIDVIRERELLTLEEIASN